MVKKKRKPRTRKAIIKDHSIRVKTFKSDMEFMKANKLSPSRMFNDKLDELKIKIRKTNKSNLQSRVNPTGFDGLTPKEQKNLFNTTKKLKQRKK